jgi:hypothetical protein
MKTTSAPKEEPLSSTGAVSDSDVVRTRLNDSAENMLEISLQVTVFWKGAKQSKYQQTKFCCSGPSPPPYWMMNRHCRNSTTRTHGDQRSL